MVDNSHDDIEKIKARYSKEAVEFVMYGWKEKLAEIGRKVKIFTGPSNLSYTELADLVRDNIITGCHNLAAERLSKSIVVQTVFEEEVKEQNIENPGDKHILYTLLAHQAYDTHDLKEGMDQWIREAYAPALELCTAENIRALEEGKFDAEQLLQLPKKPPRAPKTLIKGSPSDREFNDMATAFCRGLGNALMRLYTQERTLAKFLTTESPIINFIQKLLYGRVEEKDRNLVELIEYSPSQTYTFIKQGAYSGTSNKNLTTFFEKFKNAGEVVDSAVVPPLITFSKHFEEGLKAAKNVLRAEEQESQEQAAKAQHVKKHAAKKAALAEERAALDEKLAAKTEFFPVTPPGGMQGTVTKFAELLGNAMRHKAHGMSNDALATKYQGEGGRLPPKEVKTMLTQLRGIKDRFALKDKSDSEKQRQLSGVPTPSLDDVNTFAEVLFAKPGHAEIKAEYNQYAALVVDILQTTQTLNKANSEAAKDIGKYLLQSSVSVVLRDATGIKAFGSSKEDVEKKTKHLNTIKENRPNLKEALKADPKLAQQLAENSVGLLLTAALESPQAAKTLIKQLANPKTKEGAAQELVAEIVAPEELGR